MRRRLLILAACLLVVGFWPPQPTRVPPPLIQSSGTPPIRWDVLDQAIQDQGRWYAFAASHPVVISLPAKRITRHASSDIAACIRARENGGSYARGSNPTHTGMYQFSYSTWTANGGNPDTWQNASPEEQDQVFANTVAAHGYSDWTPYDGC